jgi:hypothetical protein
MRNSFWAVVIAAGLTLAGVALGQPNPESKPAPAQVQSEAETDKANREVLWSLSTTLLERAYRDHPDQIAGSLDEVRQSLDASFPDDPQGKATARVGLCLVLFKCAPRFGLEEFESLDADQTVSSHATFAALRVFAGMTYLSEGRDAAATKQFDKVAADPECSARLLAFMWAYRAMACSDKAEGLALCTKAMDLSEKSSEDELTLISLMARARWADSDAENKEVGQKILDLAHRSHDARTAAILPAIVSQCAFSDKEARLRVLKDSLAALQAAPVSKPEQRLSDLALLVVASRETDAGFSLRVATEAEDFASAHFDRASEQFQLARLVRAKAQRYADPTSDLGKYADLNIDEQLSVGFEFGYSFDFEEPIAEPRTHLRRKRPSDD